MDSSCLFCKISRGEIPSKKIYENETVFAFPDIKPQAPVHLLVVPKTHVASIAAVSDPTLIGDVMLAAAQIARDQGLEASGYRLVINTGDNGGQTVYHWHVHILGGRFMTWPPG